MKVRCLLVSQAFAGAFGRCSICVSARLYQLDPHWTCFRSILYWKRVLKYVDKIRVWLKWDKNIVHEDLTTL